MEHTHGWEVADNSITEKSGLVFFFFCTVALASSFSFLYQLAVISEKSYTWRIIE